MLIDCRVHKRQCDVTGYEKRIFFRCEEISFDPATHRAELVREIPWERAHRDSEGIWTHPSDRVFGESALC
jgi:hypothetical protein